MDLIEPFIEFVNAHRLLAKNDRLLLAVSGGLDSVVLTDLCHRAGYSFAIAHCNFGLRGAESDGDAAFVRQLSESIDVPYYEKRFDTQAFAAEHKLSIQEAARKLRYTWFNELLDEGFLPDSGFRIPETASGLTAPAARLLTAHHADDSVETLLLNFFKGTGIAGLHGILPLQGRIARPLLFTNRDAIAAYAAARGIRWREDASNAETKYTRNAIRKEIIPAIEKHFPQLRPNLVANIARFAEIEQVYNQYLQALLKKITVVDGNETRVPVRRLRDLQPLDTILWELCRPFGFSSAQLPALRALLDAQPGRFVASTTHRAIRHGRWLLFAPNGVPDNRVHVVEKETPSVAFGEHVVHIKTGDAPPSRISTEAAVAQLDAGVVEFPLVLRRWKAGDYFYPLGMRKKKKVARFLIDAKLSATQKEQVWVVESHKRIVWIVGHRIDDRFRITAATRKVLTLRLAAATEDPPGPAPRNS